VRSTTCEDVPRRALPEVTCRFPYPKLFLFAERIHVKTPNGLTFTEDIGNALEKQDLIRLFAPQPNEMVTSPLTLTGEARGTWYFEASFPVQMTDADGKDLAITYATAEGEWMTENFVPFISTVTFSTPETETGFLILHKDNPSGLPEHADELIVPIRFNGEAASVTPAPISKECVRTGCSGQICADTEMASTCEFREEYACYESATCERQVDGACGWTMTAALTACLNISM
jgi:Immunoglobulin-like domain of bacterial spore germination.